jgi:hypothetical protein
MSKETKQRRLMKKMDIRIKEVVYIPLKSYGQHNNIRMGGIASVEKDESPGYVLEKLMDFVDKAMDKKLEEERKRAMWPQEEGEGDDKDEQ